MSRWDDMTPEQKQHHDNMKARYEAGWTIRRIAAACGMSYGYIHRHLAEEGVEFRSRGKHEMTEEQKQHHDKMADHYAAGWSIRDIAEACGKSYSYIHRQLEEKKVEFRPRGDRRSKRNTSETNDKPAYPAPGSAIPDQPGYVVGECTHRVAGSEWSSGFRTCERCGGGTS